MFMLQGNSYAILLKHLMRGYIPTNPGNALLIQAYDQSDVRDPKITLHITTHK
jgi:hypothetical protein